MSAKQSVTFEEALERLKRGNREYMESASAIGDTSPAARERTCREGQSPYAVVVACSDSRVIPESVFNAGIGDIFTVRSAGNTMGPGELGSIEYAVSHLGCPIVVIMGHTHCGAVDAALHGGGEGHVKFITDQISRALAGETDPEAACALNARASAQKLRESMDLCGSRVVSAVYHIDDGRVEFLE